MPKLSQGVASVVRGLLAERRITVQEFAVSIGLPKSSVYRWVNQDGTFDVNKLEAIAAGLGIDQLELIRLALSTQFEPPTAHGQSTHTAST